MSNPFSMQFMKQCARNFSSDLLARATNQVAVMPAEGILWSDWDG